MTLTTRRIGLGIGTALLAFGIGAALLASPQNTAGGPPSFRPRGPQMGMGAGGPLAGLRLRAGQLGLTDDQKAQLKAIVQSHLDEWKALADKARQARGALDAAVTADVPDEATIRQLSAALAAVQADMAVARAKARAEVFHMLTPEQQAKAKQMQQMAQQRLQRMRSRMQNRMKGRG